jgi:large subunit ribosomal protein L22
MVGHKLGEFAPTRTFPGHAADKKRRGSAMGKQKLPAARRQRGAGRRHARSVVQPAEAEPGCALIRGKKVEDALNDPRPSPSKRMAGDVRKVLASAIANAENNHNLDVDSAGRRRGYRRQVGHEAFPRPRPRPSTRILKPFSRTSRIVVREVEEEEA